MKKVLEKEKNAKVTFKSMVNITPNPHNKSTKQQ